MNHLDFSLPIRLFSILLLLCSGAAVQAAGKIPFQPLDVFDLQWVSDPQISPDGKTIAYTRRGYDIMTDGGRSSIWLIDADGDNHQPLTGSADHSASPRWSPDGDRLAYVSSQNGRRQIHIRWLATGRDTAITQLQSSPGSLTWSPDGQYLAFTQFIPGSREPLAKSLNKPRGAEWAEAPEVYQDLWYRSDSAGFLKPGYSQIFVVSAIGGMPVQLTDKEVSHGGRLAWNKAASAIYFSANYADDWQHDMTESDIYRVDVASREVTRITDRDGRDSSPQVSPDGRWLAYLGNDDKGKYQDARLYVTSVEEYEPRQLSNLDRPVTGFEWGADSKSLYISYEADSVSKVGRLSMKGDLVDLASGLGGASVGRPYSSADFSVSRNGVLAHDLTESEQPANLAVTTGKRTRKLTDLNADMLSVRDVADAESMTFRSSHDGLEIQGWIIKPPGFDPTRQYPLILEIHGGPHTAYGDYFSAELQLYAAAGYVVLYTNPRGSTSYGEDFALKIYHDYPGHDYDDLMSGVDAMLATGYIDEKNLFVTGGSGGGILTAWIVTRTDRFRAAVSQKPVINWFTHTLVADIGSFFWPNWFADKPWENPAAYMNKSPVTFVQNVKTPTMLITGERDWRTPMSESEQFYQGLQMNKVPSALVRIKDAGHSIAARPSNMLNKVMHVLGWFDKYKLKDEQEAKTDD
ncbi:MAG: S9 family peptidase [Pseudomonadales bacterium]|nr:S9 family peptidase [Pseudomonadales bacterium]